MWHFKTENFTESFLVSRSSWLHHRAHRFEAHCFSSSPPHPPQALVPERLLTGPAQVKYQSELLICFQICGNSADKTALTKVLREVTSFKHVLGTETIKRGASPPTEVKESASSISIKQQPNIDQTPSSSTSKSIRDETNITTESSSSSGPNTSSIQSYDKPTFSKPSLASASITAPSNNYKHYSTINTTKSSPVDKFVHKTDLSETSTSLVSTKGEEVSLFKPATYTLSTTPSATMVTKTVSVKTNGANGKTTVTNNFKLPPFPVYIPSTSLPSVTSHLSDSGLNSKSQASSAAYSSKYSDSPASSSVTTAYSTTLSRLSSSSSSPSRTINNVNTTSTLPLHLGRNNPYLYQSESNFNNSNVTSTTANGNPTANSSYSSPGTSYSQNYNNVYSTLPKTTSNSSYGSKYDSNNDNENLTTSFSSYKYSTDYYSNLTTSTTNNTSSNNGTSTYTSSASDSNNSMYRVQYSATNPFLDPVESSPPSLTTGADNINSLLRGGVSEMKKKFEKLDSEEDLK